MRGTSQPSILVVEHEPNDEHLLKWAFTNAGVVLPIHFVHDGAEAMDYLLGIPPFNDREKCPFPDLLIMNWKMPHVDGFQLLSWLRKLQGFDHLRVAVMSGASWKQDFECARVAGAELYLNKWLEFSQLVLAIKQLIAATVAARQRNGRHTQQQARRFLKYDSNDFRNSVVLHTREYQSKLRE